MTNNGWDLSATNLPQANGDPPVVVVIDYPPVGLHRMLVPRNDHHVFMLQRRVDFLESQLVQKDYVIGGQAQLIKWHERCQLRMSDERQLITQVIARQMEEMERLKRKLNSNKRMIKSLMKRLRKNEAANLLHRVHILTQEQVAIEAALLGRQQQQQ